MAQLIDTSVLGRLAIVADPRHATADWAILELQRRGEILSITTQNLIEFRSVATRSKAQNGLGMTRWEAEAKSAGFEANFPLLPDVPDIFPRWKALVEGLGIVGPLVHDARLVAVCHVYGLMHILTFNTKHFARFAGFVPGIVVVDPASV